MPGAVFLERVRDHFQRAGWTVEDGPVLRMEVGPPVKTDLRIQRRNQRRVVLVREEAPGALEIARFSLLCKRAGLPGMLVAPQDDAVAQISDEQGVEFFAAETVGEVAVVSGPAVAPPQAPVPPRPAARPSAAPVARVPSIPAWRWAVVALIWLAALAVVAYDVVRLVG